MASITLTSAAANKRLRALNDEKSSIVAREAKVSHYTKAAGESMEPPAYDYAGTRARIAAIDDEVRAIRHALHAFNATYVLPDQGITIDEALVLMAQLNDEARRLDDLRSSLPMERETILASFNRTDASLFRYANYDIEQAARDYDAVRARVDALQLTVDMANQTAVFEVTQP